MASMGLSIDEQKAVDRFRTSVVEPSMTKLVVVDFWAEWCGPCKALTPVLEKVCAEYADKGVVLVKVNVDEEGFIASQFQVRSIPTVYAMFQGQPVADLTPARTESQLKGALDQILAQVPVSPDPARVDDGALDVAQLLAMGEEVLAGGDGERAAAIFMQIGQGVQARIEQLDHVADDRFHRVVLELRRPARAAVAAHVRRDGAKAQTAKHRQLMAPRNRQFRPAMDEDQQRCPFRSAGEIARGVPGGLDGVFGHRECHGTEASMEIDTGISRITSRLGPSRLTGAFERGTPPNSSSMRSVRARIVLGGGEEPERL